MYQRKLSFFIMKDHKIRLCTILQQSRFYASTIIFNDQDIEISVHEIQLSTYYRHHQNRLSQFSGKDFVKLDTLLQVTTYQRDYQLKTSTDILN